MGQREAGLKRNRNVMGVDQIRPFIIRSVLVLAWAESLFPFSTRDKRVKYEG